ncbi:hypothetical protein CERSUDRAFT_120341 [Gelatoporia subvermispora B]|uniref:Uncharacterized protein n=1 Tax=Ceriporiopsis subvermispora (strain B) TaxID=914234 RepID=M2QXN6_CERS8|nr:hypothetical protein CERSUDRAFT_120341 [Gelatoporia subvermispora B]
MDRYSTLALSWPRSRWASNVFYGAYTHLSRTEHKFRKIGLGSCMFKQLVQSEYADASGFAICWSTPIARIEGASGRDAQREVSVSVFRKNGFRRIGRTSFFAFRPDITLFAHAHCVHRCSWPRAACARSPQCDWRNVEECVDSRKWGCTCGGVPRNGSPRACDNASWVGSVRI